MLDIISVTPSMAYSLRRIKTSYTGNLIQVRRASDNGTSNIGFTLTGDLDTVALTAFCVATNCFVNTWYDQSGNGRHMLQATAANQPRIVNAGAIDMRNSKPALVWPSALGTYMSVAIPYNTYPISLNSVSGIDNATTAKGMFILFGNDNGPGVGVGSNTGAATTGTVYSGLKGSAAWMPTNQNFVLSQSAVVDLITYGGTTAATAWFNGNTATISGGATTTPATPTGNVYIGYNTTTTSALVNSYTQENVIISGAISTLDRKLLNRSQGAFYGITVAP